MEDGNLWKECRCVLQERARRYLMPRYLDVAWDEEFDIEPWKGSVLYVGPFGCVQAKGEDGVDEVRDAILSSNRVAT